MSEPIYFLAWSRNPALRAAATSGGFTKELLAHALRCGFVDRLIFPILDGVRPRVVCTDDPYELLTPRSNSVYQPVSSLRGLRALPADATCAMTLLPCHAELPRDPRVKLLVELLCDYTPTPQHLQRCLAELGAEPAQVRQFVFRTGLWPGRSHALLHDGRVLTGEFLWANDPTVDPTPRACQACRRIERSGDLIVGDPWELEPRFQPGRLGKTLVCLQRPELLPLIRGANIDLQPITRQAWLRSTAFHYRQRAKRDAD